MGTQELQPINTSRAETIITTSDAASLRHATAIFKSSEWEEELFGFTERNLFPSLEMFAAGISIVDGAKQIAQELHAMGASCVLV